jgi:glucose/arabinose dehydrogenase
MLLQTAMRRRSGLGLVGAILIWLFLCDGHALALPPRFIEETVVSGLNYAVGLTFASDGRMFVWEKAGKVWLYQNGVPFNAPLIDLSSEVTTWHDHGLLGFALDPNFNNNGYIYLLYAVDWGYLVSQENENGQIYPYGDPVECPAPGGCIHDTIGRLIRYRCNTPATNPVVETASRTILIGHWKTRRNGQGALAPPHITDGIAITAESHGVGSLMFATDGTLLLSVGDGGSWIDADVGGPRPSTISSNSAERDGILTPKEHVGAFRAQLIDSKNGKILRINPQTGAGVPSNPFFDAQDPFSARSRVWALGLRNPFRFSIKPGSGSINPAEGRPGVLVIGIVGHATWDQLSVSRTGGENFGWPKFEGLTPSTVYANAVAYNQDAPNPLYNGQTCTQPSFEFHKLLAQESNFTPSFPNPCNSGVQIPAAYTFMHSRPIVDWLHSTPPQARVPAFDGGGNAIAVNINAPTSPVSGLPFSGSCSVGGVYYAGSKFPPAYRDKYYFSDAWPLGRWINMVAFDSSYKPIAISQFAAPSSRVPVCMAADPQGYGLYYVNYAFSDNAGEVRRITYDCNGNGVADDVDIRNGTSWDCDLSGLPDECEPLLDTTTFINVLLRLDTTPVHVCLADVDHNQMIDGRDISKFVIRLVSP